jgi:CheY-like chemotaxis protein
MDAQESTRPDLRGGAAGCSEGAGARSGPDPGGEAARPEGGARPSTILVVEDEDSVRALLKEILTDGGYRILEAKNGAEGLETARRHDGPIDLVVTDVMMPELSGPELARRLRRERPGVPVLFISGYTGNHAVGGDATERVVFLQKPFNTADLVRTVRDLLDRPGARGTP